VPFRRVGGPATVNQAAKPCLFGDRCVGALLLVVVGCHTLLPMTERRHHHSSTAAATATAPRPLLPSVHGDTAAAVVVVSFRGGMGRVPPADVAILSRRCRRWVRCFHLSPSLDCVSLQLCVSTCVGCCCYLPPLFPSPHSRQPLTGCYWCPWPCRCQCHAAVGWLDALAHAAQPTWACLRLCPSAAPLGWVPSATPPTGWAACHSQRRHTICPVLAGCAAAATGIALIWLPVCQPPCPPSPPPPPPSPPATEAAAAANASTDAGADPASSTPLLPR